MTSLCIAGLGYGAGRPATEGKACPLRQLQETKKAPDVPGPKGDQ